MISTQNQKCESPTHKTVPPTLPQIKSSDSVDSTTTSTRPQQQQKSDCLRKVAALLKSGAVQLLEGRALTSHLMSNGDCLSKRQDLEESNPELFFSQSEALENEEESEEDIQIFALSCCWVTDSHPDPEGVYARTLARFVDSLGCARPLVFWDFVSLHQPAEDGTRTEEEESLFNEALTNLDVFFASEHARMHVVRITDLPSGGTDSPRPDYGRNGWTVFESSLAVLKHEGRIFDLPLAVDVMQKITHALRAVPSLASVVSESTSASYRKTLSGLSAVSEIAPDTPTSVEAQAAPSTLLSRSVDFSVIPLSPRHFAELVRRKEVEFRRPGDAEKVLALHEKVMNEWIAKTEVIDLSGVDLSAQTGRTWQLVDFLVWAGEGGPSRCAVRRLTLGECNVGDKELSQLIGPACCLPNLKTLEVVGGQRVTGEGIHRCVRSMVKVCGGSRLKRLTALRSLRLLFPQSSWPSNERDQDSITDLIRVLRWRLRGRVHVSTSCRPINKELSEDGQTPMLSSDSSLGKRSEGKCALM
uniref:Uncharacterized protein n=1 Tax=Chromera velia CCMP2878 TaxID=1169474 RepID=A0A0G4HZL7_9ALVE|eukprot:Cvel_9752.t1-p1 / transcript=Cvel_9752.t1 / gene=Cvel_9752 / organism=Chromera_velia_CCMP2878 / gene_product=hypothetical protein / transcript_product=hypothetical protein / location=Cvel_scaffold570:61438-63307(+) / protein_length=528 / sequence_SO=supercontig / SO=protein_coding / is_pseudo=false